MSNNTTYLGRCIINARLAKGLTQADLARKLGVSRPTVSRYERGERYISERFMLAVCGALGLSMRELCSERKKAPSEEGEGSL